jgi:hypothetical protein
MCCKHRSKSRQHVHRLHSIASGYYRRDTEASDNSMVQRMRAVSATAKALGSRRPGVEGAANILPEANQGAFQGD